MSARILNLPAKPRWWRKKFSIAIIVLLSILLHAWSVWLLPVDYDEPIYLNAAADYARFIRQGDLQNIIDYPINSEHPPLIKLLYSIPYLLFPGMNDPGVYLLMARSISAIFGVLAIWMVTRENIWAGLLWTFQAMTLKYTSQAYLEALPMMASLAAVFLLLKASESNKKFLWFSAIFLGVVAASKYPYLIILVVLLFIFVQKKLTLKSMLFYGIIAFSTFILLNPSLWHAPIDRVQQIFQFHTAYSQSQHVQQVNYPWYQPLIFLSTTPNWHPDVFFFLTSDEIMFILAIVGTFFELKDRKYTAIWLIFGITTLLLWPTKWPQYTLIVTPAVALIAGHLITRGIEWLKPKDDYWNYLEEMLPQPPKITWLILVGFVGILVLGKVGYEFDLALGRIGWNQFTVDNAPVSGNMVNDIFAGPENSIIIASNEGLNIWHPDSETLWGADPLFFDIENSTLPSNRVLSVAYDPVKNQYWFGTENGIAILEENSWSQVRNSDIGCQICQVNTIYFDPLNRIWLGTNEGIYLLNNDNWENFTAVQPGISDEVILSILYEDSENILWVGTADGVSKYQFTNEKWINETWSDNYFGWGGVADLYQSSDGRVWACTLGGGALYWDGELWQFYRNSNTPMRSNSVTTMIEGANGDFWFGMAYATEPGGYLMRKMNGEDRWERYIEGNSGYKNGEPASFTYDNFGRLWIATKGMGIQTYYREEN